MRRLAGTASLLLLATGASGQQVYTHADTLRGSIGPARAWWDVSFYDLHVRVDPADSTIGGHVGIVYRVLEPAAAGRELQVDLQPPLAVDSMVQAGMALRFRQDSAAWFAALPTAIAVGNLDTLVVYYHGRPRAAVNPPWDGGLIWRADSLGHAWIATANQGLGASVWWPNKDTQTDEPDSQRIAITVPGSMIDISNGRLRSVVNHPDQGTTTFEWFVENPINNYDVAINAGDYAQFGGIYNGEGGVLTLSFWPLSYHMAAAQKQFEQVRPMLQCFEHWFGPYPWYRDGYKLVETPHLGMEHQSAVAYGNGYGNGYRGRDLSGTGKGLEWDFIIIHESAHEWWGNNLTSADLADMWVHESFANYSESIYTECQQGTAAGADYVIGVRARVQNDAPIVPAFGVNAEGSGDMYYKGGNMLHTIRQIVSDDEKWRSILRGLNRDFRHRVVTGMQVRDYISAKAGVDLSKVFEQYLETTRIPVLEYRLRGNSLRYRWTDVVPGFDMSVRARTGPGACTVLHPTSRWQTMRLQSASASDLDIDRNYFVRVQPEGGEPRMPDGHC